MRLAKFMARAGIVSRRRAELMIREGRVRINGCPVDQPQTDVCENDSVTVDGKMIEGIKNKQYVLLNKPAGYISTAYDTHNRPTVISLISGVEARIYPVGRLDADTSGVLMLTNDGELAYRLTHPRYRVKKVYHAWVNGLPNDQILKQMSCGIIIDAGKTAPASVRLLKAQAVNNTALLEITLAEGKKRQVKKMCAAVGHPVKKLERKSFAGLTATDLPEGLYRYLKQHEIDALYRMVELKV